MSGSVNKRKRDYLLVQLLQALNKQELRDFKDFVACRYFNTDQFVIILLDTLLEYKVNEVEFTAVLQVKVYKKVFTKKEKPKGELNVKQKSFLAAKMNILLDLAKTFLCNEGLKKNDACRNELLLNSLIEKNQDQLFNRIISKEKKRLNDKSNKGFQDYENEFKLESAHLNYLTNSNLILKKDNLQELNKSIDVYYILSKLETHSLAMSISKASAGKHYNLNIMPTLAYLLNQKEYNNHTLVNLQLISIELQAKNCEEVYKKLMNQLDANYEFISKTALDSFYAIASNFCSKQIIKGNRTYYNEMFGIYQRRDKKNLLLKNNNINIGTLKNLVTLSSRVEAFDWAIQMIEKYIPSVKKELRESVYHFNLGTIAFYKNDFDQALYHFIRVENVNLIYNINCKMMILKSHYLLDNEFDERTLRIFLMAERYIKSQKKMATNNKKAYKNFVRILINIYKFKHRTGKISKENILKKIHNMDFMSDKKWLLQMLKNLPDK